jgi:hypothetical protein
MQRLFVTPFHELFKIGQQTETAPQSGLSLRQLKRYISALEQAAQNPASAQTGVVQIPEGRNINLDRAHEMLSQAVQQNVLRGDWLARAQKAVQDYNVSLSGGAQNVIPETEPAAPGDSNVPGGPPGYQGTLFPDAPPETTPTPETAPSAPATTPDVPGQMTLDQARPGYIPQGDDPNAPLRIEPTEQEITSGTAAIDALERDYHEVLQQANMLSAELKQDFDAWRPMYDTFNAMRPAWQHFREQLRANPRFVNTLDASALQSAQQQMEQAKAVMGELMTQERSNDATTAKFMNSANAALTSIQQLVNIATQPAQSRAAKRTPSLSAYAGSAARLFQL